ncbi:extracellular solute-binding protein [bacterium]|nr:extracellular solute-binding protein [bacterium]
MKRKIFLIIFILLLLGACLLPFISEKNVADDKVVVTFWTLQLSTFDKYINNIISEFEAQNPNIKIKWIDVPYSEGEKRTLSAILTDNPPDLVNLTPDFSLLLAQKNALYNIPEEKMSQFVPSLSKSLMYDGKYFAIPFYATSAVTLYNKHLFFGNIPKTYDDLFNIRLKNSYVTMIPLSENDTLLKILNKYNINSPQTVNSPESIKIFEKIKQLFEEDQIPKESVTQTHRDALEKYMSGQMAFIVTGANFINMIKENAPSVYNYTEILPQLTGKTGAYDYSLMNFIIPKKSHAPKEALKFALFFTNEQNQLEFAKLTTVLPVNKFALDNTYFTQNIDNSLQSKARIISAKQLSNLQPPLSSRNKKELNNISSNYIQEILINNRNIKETLDNFSKDWQKLN